jgi:Flp pilus assembly protein TadB
MGEDEHRELWAAIQQIRAENAATNLAVQNTLARIETMLSERCEARVERIKAIEEKQESQDSRLDKLEQLRAQIGVIAALGSMVGGGAVVVIFQWLGK